MQRSLPKTGELFAEKVKEINKNVSKKVAENKETIYGKYARKYATQASKFPDKQKSNYSIKHAQTQQGTRQESLQVKWRITRDNASKKESEELEQKV